MKVSVGFGERIEKLSQAAGSANRLADLTGISRGTMTNWKREAGMLPSKLASFADAAGISLAWLLTGEGDEEAEIARFLERFPPADPMRDVLHAARVSAFHGASVAPQRYGARGKLAAALQARRLTVPQLAKLTRYDAGVLENVVNGTGRASEKMIEAIVRELPELSKEDLMEGSDVPPILAEDGSIATYGAKPNLELQPGMKGRIVPLLSMAQAGAWDAGHTDEGYAHEGIFALNVEDRRAFAIRVSGNSMEPDICEGDVVVCAPSAELHNGDCAVVRTHSGQAFIKFWRRKDDKITLESANADYQPLHFPAGEIAGAWPVVQTIASGRIRKS